MERRIVFTENPQVEQWRLIAEFMYPRNVRNRLEELTGAQVEQRLVDLVAGSISQAQSYFQAAAQSTLEISPLLLYYGASNLLYGATCLLTARIIDLRNHGLRLRVIHEAELCETELRPFDPHFGALQIYANTFWNSSPLVNSGHWTLKEIIGSLPDLIDSFDKHYQRSNETPYAIPVEPAMKDNVEFHRIHINNLSKFPNTSAALQRIERLHKAYLTPQITDQYVILYKKLRGDDITTLSIGGQPFLQLAHIKHNTPFTPPQVILFAMASFAVGYLSRYHPDKWYNFVRADHTGERLLIQHFVDVAIRFIPNLVLNELMQSQICFTVYPRN